MGCTDQLMVAPSSPMPALSAGAERPGSSRLLAAACCCLCGVSRGQKNKDRKTDEQANQTGYEKR
jgi:hypothetical protein